MRPRPSASGASRAGRVASRRRATTRSRKASSARRSSSSTASRSGATTDATRSSAGSAAGSEGKPMELLVFLRVQVRANRLANHRLHAAMAALSREDYEAPRTSFFPSLAKTLEHILAVDLYYLAALHGERGAERIWREAPAGVPFATIAAAQAASDQRFIDHVNALGPPSLDEMVEMERGQGRIQRDRR